MALFISSRQAPVKLGFNLANYLLLAVVMIAVFRAIQHSTGAPGLFEYAAGFAATLVAAVVGAVSIAAAITLSGGAPQFKKLPDMLQFGALVAVANTSIALLAVTILWFAPTAIWLLAIPIVVLFLAYGAWVSEREKHERLEMIYQSSRILQHSPELDVALVALLDHARSMFRAELAEIVLESGGDNSRAVRTSSIQDGESETIVPIREMEIHPSLEALITERRAGLVVLPRTPGRPPDGDPAGDGGAAGGGGRRHRPLHHREPPDGGHRVRPGRRPAAGDPGQPGWRGAGERPAGAVAGRAVPPEGAAPLPGLPRPADRHAEPAAVHRDGHLTHRRASNPSAIAR